MLKKLLTCTFMMVGIGLVLPIQGVAPAMAEEVTMIKDINLMPKGSSPQNITIVGNLAFFVADDGINGKELWCTDGTEQGTMMVKDIYPGEHSSSPEYLVPVNGILMFSASDGSTGQELWKTDGSEAGTVLVKDINFGGGASYPGQLLNMDGVLFFSARGSSESGEELWRSDGSAAGTVMVKDIHSGSYRGSEPESLTNVEGTLYFTASDDVHGRELWMSDGTSTGTVLVKDIDPDNWDYDGPEDLTNVGGTLFFTATDGVQGRELWKSNGNSTSTVLVKMINPDTSDYFGPEDLINVNGTLFFTADDGEHGQELWKSDGTLEGTVQVKDLSPGWSGGRPSLLTQFEGALYFHAYASGSSGLFKSNGTEAGTRLVMDMTPYEMTVVGQSLFLNAYDSAGGYELWHSDGTAVGTTRVKDINPGSASSHPSKLTDFNGRCLFAATNMDYGNELWLSNSTEAETRIVKDIHTLGNLGSRPSLLTNYQNTLYFWVSSGEPGLWTSDGSVSGTERIISQPPPSKMIHHNDTLCYVSQGRLYASDGTTAGTYDWFKGTGFDENGISQFTPFRGATDAKEIIYFSIKDSLYKTYDNGDCILVKEINNFWWGPIEEMTVGYQDTNPLSAKLFFTAHTGGFFRDRELFVSDGTLAGTKLVKDIGGSDNGDPQNLTDVNGLCYFHASDGDWSSDHGRELWKSDGTAAGTVMVRDITKGREDTDFGEFVAVKERLYFIAHEVLWTSDGTAQGTHRLVHFAVDQLTPFGDKLLFVGNESTQCGETWISDGTIAGTFPLKDIVPDFDGLSVQNLTRSGDKIILVVNGVEIWETDGTSAGTRFLGSVYESAINPPDQFIEIQSDLFFTATDVEHGNELWKIGGVNVNVLSGRY